jgi:lipopolysaccharide transport system ATP-binding protein
MSIVISVENLSKSYRLGQIGTGTLSYDLKLWWARVRGKPNPFLSVDEQDDGDRIGEVLWALNGVSFQVKEGEVLGIIGRNGAGKSTILKILSRVTAPTSGKIKIKGRVASLLEVGTGFHPDLTGRENIFLNGAILGMERQEIQRKFDQIVEFAGVEKFIETPVKRYSSGMYVRLAFSVAAHLDPEILVVDEVLAVGDAEFQKKCLGKMGDVAKEGRTVLFVSHQMPAIENLCSRALLIHQGQIIDNNTPRDVIAHYLAAVLDPAIQQVSWSDRTDRRGTGDVRFTSFHIEDTSGKKIAATTSGTDVFLVFGYEIKKGSPVRNIDMGFSIHSFSNNQPFCVLYSSYTGSSFQEVPDSGFFRCLIPRFPFAAGRYRIGARIVADGNEADWPQDGIGYINVEAGDFYGSGNMGFAGNGNVPFLITGKWSVENT